RRFIHGPSGEILDAFVFTSFDAGTTTTSLKLGRHNVYWGNSLFPQSAQSSIAFSQGALDNQKAAVSPGVETKELFLPQTKLIGLSVERNFGKVNVGAELTYRTNTTLRTASGVQALLDSDRPARGDAVGFLVNAITLLPRTALWEGGELAAELAYNKVRRVT